MPRGVPTPAAVRELIVKLRHDDEMSIRAIAEHVKRHKSVVSDILAKYDKCNSTTAGISSGRPRITSKTDDNTLVRLSKKDRFQTAASISREVGHNHGMQVSRNTVSRRLKEAGLNSRSPAVKPLISKKNRIARQSFAAKHVVWSDDDWAKVYFSDESKFNLFGSDGKRYVRRSAGERLSKNCVKSSVKFGGGSVMVFGMFSASGTGPLVRMQGKINAKVYKELLQMHVVPFLKSSSSENPIFMQDNAPCHTAKLVKSFLQEEEVDVLDWPAQSPDLNPIENLWKVLGERTMKSNPKNINDLWITLQAEWSKITPEECSHLVMSCSRRCQAVIDSKGYHTKY